MMAPYMPLFVADYLADTAHLSAAEHGGYMLLIMNYWQRQKPLPNDDKKLARIARMTDSEWLDARETILELFVIDGAELRHKRIEAELIRLADKSDKAREAAEKSVLARQANAQRTLNGRSTDVELSGEDKRSKKEGGIIAPAPSERAAALKAIEAPCLEIVAGTEWPVTTAQDWHALTAIVVEHRLDPETELLPSIREQVARKRAKRETVRNWGYFVPGCLAFAAKAREPPQPLAPHTPTTNTGQRHDRSSPTRMQLALDALKPRGERPVGSGDGRTIDATYEASAH